jgi:predicted NAD/FAD-binding protein
VAGQAVPPARSAFLRTTGDENLTTYGEFLEREGFSSYFIAHYAIPVVSCVWSAGRETDAGYPARYLFQFLDHHGMLRVTGSPAVVQRRRRIPQLRRAARRTAAGRARAHAVTDIARRPDGVEIRDVTGQVTRVDRVVIATHADQASACSPTRATRGHHPQAVRLLEQRDGLHTTARCCRRHATPARRGTTG